MVQCMRGPTPSAGSMHSTPQWHQRSTKALLNRESLTRYYVEHKPQALRSTPPTNRQSVVGRPACTPGARQQCPA